jgi:ABC-type multidrug transport system fused ATPase/permease subunit
MFGYVFNLWAAFWRKMGFFDACAITSRLSSDTTLVGDQVSLNVFWFGAGGFVLICMCVISWQLCIVTFITVPLITVLSKCYGYYVRALK